MLRKLERFAVNPYDSSTVFNEQDRMPFTYIEGYLDFSITIYLLYRASCIRSDQFYLDGSKHLTKKSLSSSILQRFAFSQGFAASGIYKVSSYYFFSSESWRVGIIAKRNV